MHMKNIKTLVLAAVSAALLSAPAQAATMLTGNYSINGAFVPVDLTGSPTSLGSAEAIDFLPLVSDPFTPTPGAAGEFLVGQAQGDFAHLLGETGTIKDIALSGPGNANYPWVPLAGFQMVGDVRFDLESLTVLQQDDEFLLIQGSGYFNRDGFLETAGQMNFTGQTVGENGLATFTWSSSQAAEGVPVPEPTSMILMGLGLFGFAAMLRRRS
jgi:opacity protein-like surface antigen